jgi:tRNA-splicing ligase RtcB
MSDGAVVSPHGLRTLDGVLWEIPADARSDMRVPARVFADLELLDEIANDRSLEQLQNVTTLPGVRDAVLAMPDIHQGHGFPAGTVAATEPPDGVVSPGGVGYDISCGVRLLALPLSGAELGGRAERLVHEIARRVPVGAGHGGSLRLAGDAFDRVLIDGPRALLGEHHIGTVEDVERTESSGSLPDADPGAVSQRARARGADQLGTLGSGNHFLEVQKVAEIFGTETAAAFGLSRDQVTVLIHSGSRGFGHQVCTDYVRRMDAVLATYEISLPDRQLACAPLSSAEGSEYMRAMSAAANFACANRAVLAHRVRESIAHILGAHSARDTRQVYDVAHNVAKLEQHHGRLLCVHRKCTTRAFPPGSDAIPAAYWAVGQPVFIPGSMGTSSFVLAGREGAMERSFGTTCHGAGRRMSRTSASRLITGAQLRRQLEARGIGVRCPSDRGLAEEAPFAYRDVERVVAIVERAGLAARVAKLVPLGVVKG